jgi:hypothetical protein
MAIIASWAGDGLAGGTTVTTSTAGTGDTAFNQVAGTGGNITVSATGVRSPRLAFPTLTSQTKFLVWTSATIGSRTNYAVRCYVEVSAIGSLSSSFFRLRNSGTDVWRVDIAGTSGSPPGEVRLRGAGGALLADSGALGLSAGTVYRLEGVVSSGSVTLKVYEGESLLPFTTLAGTVGTTVDTFDIGMVANTTSAIQYFDDIAMSDTASEIGPVAPSGATITVWNGTTEVSATIEGVWDGVSIIPASFDQIE